MINAFTNGGPFMIILLLLALIIIFLSIRNFKQPFFTNGIMLLGILSVTLGILSTYLGVSNAFRAIKTVGDINPYIVLEGLKIATIPSVTGGIIMLASTGIWYYFVRRHNLLIV